ncbi:hypothetical protein [Sinorhizobium meliloti]|nr:hypothetical protein [Sinorhizobium meliloti]
MNTKTIFGNAAEARPAVVRLSSRNLATSRASATTAPISRPV